MPTKMKQKCQKEEEEEEGDVQSNVYHYQNLHLLSIPSSTLFAKGYPLLFLNAPQKQSR